MVCVLLGISPASKFDKPTFRNVGLPKFDAGEIPKRTHTILKTRRKFEIKYHLQFFSAFYVDLLTAFPTMPSPSLQWNSCDLIRGPSHHTTKSQDFLSKLFHALLNYWRLISDHSHFPIILHPKLRPCSTFRDPVLTFNPLVKCRD
jgi:hypothetical protein